MALSSSALAPHRTTPETWCGLERGNLLCKCRSLQGWRKRNFIKTLRCCDTDLRTIPSLFDVIGVWDTPGACKWSQQWLEAGGRKSRWIMQLKMITIHKLLVLQPRVVSAKLRGDYMMYDTKAKLLSSRSPSSLCAIIKGEIINQSGSMAVIALNTCHTWYTHSTHYDERWRRKVFRF